MSIHLTCPSNHEFSVKDETIGTIVPCPKCRVPLLIFVEARPISVPTGALLGAWRNEGQLIVLAEQALWLAKFKEENQAQEAHAMVCKGKQFKDGVPGQPVMTSIRMDNITAIRVIQEWEESTNFHVESAAGDGKTNSTEVTFANGADRDRAVQTIQARLHWRLETSQVGLGQAITVPSLFLSMLSLGIIFYWGMSYLIEGKECPTGRGSSYYWVLLHVPINIVGIKWISIILGSGAVFFLIQLVQRTITRPIQKTLLPAAKEKTPNTQAE